MGEVVRHEEKTDRPFCDNLQYFRIIADIKNSPVIARQKNRYGFLYQFI